MEDFGTTFTCVAFMGVLGQKDSHPLGSKKCYFIQCVLDCTEKKKQERFFVSEERSTNRTANTL